MLISNIPSKQHASSSALVVTRVEAQVFPLAEFVERGFVQEHPGSDTGDPLDEVDKAALRADDTPILGQ